ncbi:hypothetical protein ACFOET_11840 [Parapedobacter deserti]|uniref:Uncharacterized protein n=1 Tax=Parapedobacter deserti TaxID=1912957 RepID=A0ABV7JJQ5_9SPHI
MPENIDSPTFNLKRKIICGGSPPGTTVLTLPAMKTKIAISGNGAGGHRPAHPLPDRSGTAARGLATCLLSAGYQPGVCSTLTAGRQHPDSQLTRLCCGEVWRWVRGVCRRCTAANCRFSGVLEWPNQRNAGLGFIW